MTHGLWKIPLAAHPVGVDPLPWLDRAKSEVHSTVLGEPIMDEYIYVTPRGKSPKENIVTYQKTGTSELYRGGAWVVGENLGRCAAGMEFGVMSDLCVRKTRRVQREFMAKVYEESEVPEWPNPLKWRAGAMTVVADFGHGIFPDRIHPQNVREQAGWLGLTVQANSLNWGFSTLKKWDVGPDYVVLDQVEARLATGLQFSDAQVVAERVMEAFHPKVFAMTLGHDGALITDGKDTFRCPALADKIVDRMGAGDAFLAWSAPLAYLGAPLEVTLLVGSMAAALKVGKRGNEAITRAEMIGALKAVIA